MFCCDILSADEKSICEKCLKMDQIIIDIAKAKFHSMKTSTKTRQSKNPDMPNVEFVSWGELYHMLIVNDTYQPKNTHFKFQMNFTLGFHNSVSFDRIDDSKGYSKSNVQVRPLCLNTCRHLLDEHFEIIEKTRVKSRTFVDIISVFDVDNCERSIQKLATSLRSMGYDMGKYESFEYILNLFIKQGGRCNYSGVPLLFDNSPLTCSVKRIDPSNSDLENNLVLIAKGLHGIFAHKQSTSWTKAEKLKHIQDNKFSQQYWDSSTNVSCEIKQLIELERKKDMEILDKFIPYWKAKEQKVDTKQFVRCCGTEPGKQHYVTRANMCKNKNRTGGFGTQCKKCMMIRKQKYKKRKFEEVS